MKTVKIWFDLAYLLVVVLGQGIVLGYSVVAAVDSDWPKATYLLLLVGLLLALAEVEMARKRREANALGYRKVLAQTQATSLKLDALDRMTRAASQKAGLR